MAPNLTLNAASRSLGTGRVCTIGAPRLSLLVQREAARAEAWRGLGCSWLRSRGLPALTPTSSSTFVSKDMSSDPQGFSGLVHVYHTELRVSSSLMARLGWKRDTLGATGGASCTYLKQQPLPGQGSLQVPQDFHTPVDVSVEAFLPQECGGVLKQAGWKEGNSLGLKLPVDNS